VRLRSDAEKKIWGEEGELLLYLKNVKAIVKEDQEKKVLEKS
jgi:hypothetical protein